MTTVPTLTLNDGRAIPQLGFGVLYVPPEQTAAAVTSAQLGNIAIPKSVTPARIRQNIDIFDLTLDVDEMRQLNRLATSERIGPDPDTFNVP
jgi:diketogulonate reductase-like aldo/keto reductase